MYLNGRACCAASKARSGPKVCPRDVPSDLRGVARFWGFGNETESSNDRTVASIGNGDARFKFPVPRAVAFARPPRTAPLIPRCSSAALTRQINKLAMHPSAPLCFTAHEDGLVKLWDLAAGVPRLGAPRLA